jgi:hypothetical protein
MGNGAVGSLGYACTPGELTRRTWPFHAHSCVSSRQNISGSLECGVVLFGVDVELSFPPNSVAVRRPNFQQEEKYADRGSHKNWDGVAESFPALLENHAETRINLRVALACPL